NIPFFWEDVHPGQDFSRRRVSHIHDVPFTRCCLYCVGSLSLHPDTLGALLRSRNSGRTWTGASRRPHIRTCRANYVICRGRLANRSEPSRAIRSLLPSRDRHGARFHRACIPRSPRIGPTRRPGIGTKASGRGPSTAIGGLESPTIRATLR